MRYLLFTFLAVVGLVIGYSASLSLSKKKDVQVRSIAAKNLPDLARSYDSNLVLVSVWATWCHVCLKEIPVLKRSANKLADQGVELAFLGTDDPRNLDKVKGTLKGLGIEGTTFLRSDGEEEFIPAIDSSWTGSLPALLIFDRKGNKRYFVEGALPGAKIEALAQAFL